MKIKKIYFKNCFKFSSLKYHDHRGFFSEIYNLKKIQKNLKALFKCKQINYVLSKKNSLRGLHLQKKPFGQKKIIRVLEGEILDIILDVRKDSKTFGLHKKIKLSDKNFEQLFIPDGFAHGYLTLSKIAKVEYLCSNYYKKKSELTINLHDKDLNIDLSKYGKKFLVSSKDKLGISFKDFINKN